MENAITITRAAVVTFGSEVSKLMYWNFQTIWLVSLTNTIANSTIQQNSSACFAAHRGDLFRISSSATHFLEPQTLRIALQTYGEEYNL